MELKRNPATDHEYAKCLVAGWSWCEGKARNKVLSIAVKKLIISLRTDMNVHGSKSQASAD
jgi:hypothetical protein